MDLQNFPIPKPSCLRQGPTRNTKWIEIQFAFAPFRPQIWRRRDAQALRTVWIGAPDAANLYARYGFPWKFSLRFKLIYLIVYMYMWSFGLEVEACEYATSTPFSIFSSIVTWVKSTCKKTWKEALPAFCWRMRGVQGLLRQSTAFLPRSSQGTTKSRWCSGYHCAWMEEASPNSIS